MVLLFGLKVFSETNFKELALASRVKSLAFSLPWPYGKVLPLGGQYFGLECNRRKILSSCPWPVFAAKSFALTLALA